MKKVILIAILTTTCAVSAFARPNDPGHRPGYRPMPQYNPKHHSSNWGWGLNFSPFGATVGFGTRIGKHGAIGISLPLFSTPTPVIERETVYVQQPVVQQPVIIQQPVYQQPAIIQPAAPQQVITPKVWVDGYWRVTRSPDGVETQRIWVPGHWE